MSETFPSTRTGAIDGALATATGSIGAAADRVLGTFASVYGHAQAPVVVHSVPPRRITLAR